MKNVAMCLLNGIVAVGLIAGMPNISHAEDAMMKKDDGMKMKDDAMKMKDDAMMMKDDAMMMKDDAMMMKGDAMMMKKDGKEVAISGFCPVCVMHGMMNKGTDQFTYEYEGKIYMFAGADQLKMFKDNPKAFTEGLAMKYKQLGGK